MIKKCGNPNPPKPVIGTCIKTGKEVRFKSAFEADKRGFAFQQIISQCCNGIRKSTGGYRWRFAQ